MVMRLQKFLARAGVASRRHAEDLITAGRVTVDGVVAELGVSVDPDACEVRVDGGVPIRLVPEHTTIMLHKPAGYVTTMDDPQGRATVADLVPTDRFPGVFPVGRLDRDTTGLLLFTTDGELGNALLHPRRHVEKRYIALVEGSPDARALERLRRGVRLSDGMTLPARAELLRGEDASWAARAIGTGEGAGGFAASHTGKRSRAVREKTGSYVLVGLREGRKREVRRMLEAVGHPVIALHRASFGPLDLGNLARGSWRELSGPEVDALRRACAGEDGVQ